MPRPLHLTAVITVAFLAGTGALRAAGLAETPIWTVEGRPYPDTIGTAVASAGDVNGDGYADLIVGWPLVEGSDPYDHRGEVQLYLGSATGPSLVPDQVLISPEPGFDYGSEFGYSLSTAGDWNGDGYDDVAIGGAVREGAGEVFIFLGSPGGLSPTPAWAAFGDVESCCAYGGSIASAGDVNGDGYPDLIVGNSQYNSGALDDAGRAYVYFGGPAAASAPAWTYEGEQDGGLLGDRVAGAGDVNGDGYADIIVNQPLWNYVTANRGRVLVFLGSAAGPGRTPTWTRTGVKDSMFGSAVAAAGDVNGDGYADILIGNNQVKVHARPGSGQTGYNWGKAYLYLGSRSGPSKSPQWTLTGDQDSAFLGDAVASAGDVNHDGFSDVIVSAPYRDSPLENQGQIYLYLGSSKGVLKTRAWTWTGSQIGEGNLALAIASAGDVNGDTFSDVVVGAPGFDSATSEEVGRVELFLGQSP